MISNKCNVAILMFAIYLHFLKLDAIQDIILFLINCIYLESIIWMTEFCKTLIFIIMSSLFKPFKGNRLLLSSSLSFLLIL